jgi:hypothetical protein
VTILSEPGGGGRHLNAPLRPGLDQFVDGFLDLLLNVAHGFSPSPEI